MNSKSGASVGQSRGPGFVFTFLLLAGIITILLGGAFLPGRTLFSNDGPLGRLMSDCHRLPDAWRGVWEDLNSVGYQEQGALPNITWGLRWLLKPILFSKFYAATAILILGLGAWCFFRQLKLAPAACILGGIAAALNSDFFSTACWGIASHPLTVGLAFFAMAALLKNGSWRSWLYVLLAGAAVGLGLAEGADVGAIFSIYVAAFAMYHAWIAEGPRVKNLLIGGARVAVVAIFAGLIAAQAIFALVHTQVEGIAGMEQDEQSIDAHWQWATRWSLPKREALGLVIPGVFGYRLDTTNGGYYWGSLGRSPAWDKFLADGQQGKRPTDILRQTGSGIYAGVTVALVAFWAAIQAFRRKESVFTLHQQKWLWFWIGVAVISLLLSFGKYAPFYWFIYKLPYLSTIRNPVKYMTVANLALIVIFAYGVDGLWRTYLAVGKNGIRRTPAMIHFDKMWMRGCLVFLGASLVGWLIYANARESLQMYLEVEQFTPLRAHEIAAFSIGQVGWFVLFFILVAGLMSLIINGHFAGARARWAAIALGLILTVDLGRADQPWIMSWDYQAKYATNPILDILRDKPYEHRVALLPFHGRTSTGMEDVYRYEWSQHEFQYYNIQSYDIVQLPRAPQDLDAFRKATFFDGSPQSREHLIRRWELSNTRYLLGTADIAEALNTELDTQRPGRFHILKRFNLVDKPVIDPSMSRFDRLTAQLDPNGQYALFEFDGALPRAKLWSGWVVNTNMQDAMQQILAPQFDPSKTLIVDSGLPDNAKPGANPNPGTVDFVSYAPKDVVLDASANSTCILQLNDRIAPGWKATVDGKPVTIVRCNFFMRGVYLEPGKHRVEFRFDPPGEALHISVATIVFTLFVIGVTVATGLRGESETEPRPEPSPEKPKNGSNGNGNGNGNGKSPEVVSNGSAPESKRKPKPAVKAKR